jgi:site-specific recombinase XerD
MKVITYDRGQTISGMDLTVVDTAEATMLAKLTRYSDQARGAHAANTLRAIRADTAVFTAWCSNVGLTSLPADADTVAAFVDAMGEVKAPATVRRYIASVSHLHRAAELPNPAVTTAVRLALKQLHRAKNRAQVQATPLLRRYVDRMLAATGHSTRALRNRALLAVAYDTMCRRN